MEFSFFCVLFVTTPGVPATHTMETIKENETANFLNENIELLTWLPSLEKVSVFDRYEEMEPDLYEVLDKDILPIIVRYVDFFVLLKILSICVSLGSIL